MSLEYLRQRFELLDLLRAFFKQRGFLEVATPLARTDAIAETHIDLFTFASRGERHYLQASPELAMKELLCEGSGPIFQITPAFRAGDYGPLHRPEFTMVEWYRPGDDMQAGMNLLAELACATLDCADVKRSSYAEIFQRTLGFNPHAVGSAELHELVSLHAPQSLTAISEVTDPDFLLNVLLTQCVEAMLGSDAPEIVYHYPARQAALAQTSIDAEGHKVAERFELFVAGVELANGYHELTDATDMRERLVAANHFRVADGREPIPLPERLLGLMESRGLPSSSGVALGFDRLLMLRTGASELPS